MNILGIDIGAHTGIAIGQFPDPTRPAEGCLAMTCTTWDLGEKDLRPVRLASFMSRLDRLLLDHASGRNRIDAIAYEVPFVRGEHATKALIGQAGVLEALAAEYGRRLCPLSVGTIKKTFTGKGNASKEEMMARALELGYNPTTDHEADAIAAVQAAWKLLVKEVS